MTKRLTEELGIVYVIKPADHEAGVAGDSIKLEKYRHATFILQFGTVTGDAVLNVYSGATDGTKTTKEAIKYRLADADQGSAGADNFGDETEDANGDLTLTAATYDNKTLIVEVDAADLTADQEFVTLDLSNAASALNVACVAILSGPRYQASDMPTAIPTS